MNTCINKVHVQKMQLAFCCSMTHHKKLLRAILAHGYEARATCELLAAKTRRFGFVSMAHSTCGSPRLFHSLMWVKTRNHFLDSGIFGSATKHLGLAKNLCQLNEKISTRPTENFQRFGDHEGIQAHHVKQVEKTCQWPSTCLDF